jgi:hypothetical protein
MTTDKPNKTKKYYQYQYLMERVFRIYHQILGTLKKSASRPEIDKAMIRHDFYFDWLKKINNKHNNIYAMTPYLLELELNRALSSTRKKQ